MKDKYYIKLKTYNPLAARYGYFDKGNKAESLFEDAGIKVKGQTVFMNDNSWQFIICKIPKNSSDEFERVMERLKNKLLICGENLEEVDEIMDAFERRII